MNLEKNSYLCVVFYKFSSKSVLPDTRCQTTSGMTESEVDAAFTKLACMIWDISLLSQLIISEIVAERRLKALNCCKYKENLSILTFV